MVTYRFEVMSPGYSPFVSGNIPSREQTIIELKKFVIQHQIVDTRTQFSIVRCESDPFDLWSKYHDINIEENPLTPPEDVSTPAQVQQEPKKEQVQKLIVFGDITDKDSWFEIIDVDTVKNRPDASWDQVDVFKLGDRVNIKVQRDVRVTLETL